LTSIGGDVTIYDNAALLEYDSKVTDTFVGLCIIKAYKENAVIGENAVIKLNAGGVDIAIGDLKSCDFLNSINGVTINKAYVYPNPVKDKLFIQSDGSGIAKVEVYNVVGELVYSTTNGQQTIDLARLASGHYILTVTTKNNSVEKIKVIKL
jgi:hypothetical protein